MPMPRLPPTHDISTAKASAFQLKKNRAATAPAWNAPMMMVVNQLTCVCDFLPSTSSDMVCESSFVLPRSVPLMFTLNVESAPLCNTCVILDEPHHGRNQSLTRAAKFGRDMM